MTGGTIRALGLAGAVAAVSMAGAGGAQAGAFGLREQSAQGLGVAFAGAASGGAGVSSIFWNPATVTMRPGFASEQSLSFINLSGEITPTVGTAPGLLPFGASGEVGQGAVVPSGATSYQLTDRLWVGIQTGAPYGLVTKPRQDWAGSVYARSSRIFSLAFNPVVGFKVNDWLSIAAGPSIEYFRLTLRAAVPVSGTFPGLYPSGFIKGESWGVGFTAGVLVTPAAGTAIGVGYRSSVHHDIAGSIGFPDPRQAIALGQVRANLNTPEKVSVGLTQAINPVTRINLGFEWDNWSRLGDVGIVSRALGVTVNHLPLNFKDSFFYSIGAEYDWSPNLTLRAGFGYDNVPIDFSNRSARLPDSDRYVVSIGGSYRWSEKVLLTASYAHAFFDRGLLLAGPGRDYNIAHKSHNIAKVA